MELLTDILLDTIADSIRMLPFLFSAFLLLEALEHYSGTAINRAFIKINKAGPVLGALSGCIPQCGFSVMAANLYAGGVISLGTLLSVFLATSDEAVLILLGHPGRGKDIMWLIVTKIIIAMIAGFLTDLCFRKKIASNKRVENLCHHCGCHEHHGILRPALHHTLKLFAYLFIFSGALNLLIAVFGLHSISGFLLKDNIFQPLLAGFIGFIPNCAASVILTELYLSGALSFAAVIAGLCTNCGVGLIVLFKVNESKGENLKIAGLLYVFAAIAGILLNAISR